MYISSVELKSYAVFRDSGIAHFKQGINIITGQNSAGKSALLKALDFQNNFSKPHISTKTLPLRNRGNLSDSEITLELAIFPDDLRKFIEKGNGGVWFPHPYNRTDISRFLNDWSSKNIEGFGQVRLLLDQESGKFSIIKDATGKGLNLYRTAPGDNAVMVANDGQSGFANKGGVTNGYNSISFLILAFENVKKNIYRFDPERLNIGRSHMGTESNLRQNGSNLPTVLNLLQSEPVSFDKFNKLIHAVLPNVGYVLVKPINNDLVEIRVSSLPKEIDRTDISFPLNECGTGVSQVLAILYVIHTAYTPKIFVIDEPASFLHPGAAKALIEVFKQNPQHQYIIGTHSPLIISAAEPSTITRVALSEDNQESTFISVNRDENRELQDLLGSLGLGLSDIFGADSVLWVEGPTEVKCFPLLLRHAERPLYRTQIAKVWQTSDMEVSNKGTIELRRIVESYRELSSGGASESLAPPALGFFIDREDRSNSQITRMREIEKGKIGFTNYRLYENYLLHSQAIAQILNQLDSNSETQTMPEAVEAWLQENLDKEKYAASKLKQNQDRPLSGVIDAANLLKDLFAHFSEHRVEYRKTRDSVALTKWLLENDPEHLSGIIQELTTFIDQCKENQ